MKKAGYILIGMIVGVVLSFSMSAYGADISLIGKKVQGEADVTVNGESIGKAVVIDGRSYAPVRSIGESAGYDVSVEGKNIILNGKEQEQKTVDEAVIKDILQGGQEMTKEAKLRQLEYKIDSLKVDIKTRELKGADQETINGLLSELKSLEAEKAALEAQQ